MIQRILAMSGRAKIFVVAGILILILGFTGVLSATRDVELTREEAIALALPLVDFEPDRVEARLVRQGFSMIPVWAVSLSIPTAGNPREFVELATVEINAATGEVFRISLQE